MKTYKNKFTLLVIISSMLLTSCAAFFNGYNPETTYTKLSETNCNNPSKEVTLFFKGEEIDFEYKKIGIIEIYGGDYDNNDDILKELKKSAKEKCADAIIQIENGYVEKEKKFIFELNDKNIEKYQSKFFKGIIVQHIEK